MPVYNTEYYYENSVTYKTLILDFSWRHKGVNAKYLQKTKKYNNKVILILKFRLIRNKKLAKH